MTGINIFSSHLQKLGHPIKEIRERALNQLLAKLKYGFKFDDELARTRELLEVLFQWFSYEKPTFQKEILSLMMFALKADGGNTLIREIGVADLMRNLDDIKEKVNGDSEELFNKILDTVRFLSILQSAERENIPKLDIPVSACSSKSDPAARQSDNNILTGILSITDGDANDTLGFEDRNNCMQNCIRVLLLPWIQPCKSDLVTLSLIEDTLQMVKSTKKCCRFLKDVLIKDFQPDIFFNRPLIVKKLQTLVGIPGRIVDVLEVLLSITISANNRIDQLFNVSMCNSKFKVQMDEKTMQNIDVEDVERIVSGASKTNCAINLNCLEDNVALNQLPVPYFCLDTMYEVILSLGRNVIVISSGDNEDAFGMEEINIAFSLLSALTTLLFKCVDKTVWVVAHNKKILKDIVQKSFMVMREGGELLNKYCTSFLADNNKVHHRLAYLQLIPVCLALMRWADSTPLLPNSLCTGLQNALSDVVLSYTHPLISSELAETFQSIKSMVNKDYSKKYTEMLKTCQAIQSASLLIKTPDKYKDNVDVIDIIKKSLSVLELHNSRAYVKFIMKIFILKLHTWSLEEDKVFVVKKILLSLLASHVQWVQIEVYRTISASVINVLTKGSKSDLNGLNEESLQFLMDSNVMTEILCHGLSSNNPAVKTHASDIIVYLIRGKLVLSEKIWMLFLQNFQPVMPLLHAYAAQDNILGNAIIKSLDLNIAECMQLPKKEIVNGNVRLLFVKSYTAQMEGAHNLCAILNTDDSVTHLPPASAIRPDLLIAIVRRVKPTKFNIYTRSEEEQVQQHDVGLIQVLDLLKNGLILDESYLESVTDLNDISNNIEPTFRRSTLQQLAVMMQQPSLHNSFLEYKGLQLVYVHLRLSLCGEDFAVFADCSKSCISILNSVLSTSGVARQTMLKKCGICPLILRAMLHFPNDDSVATLATQTLFLLVFSSYLLQDLSNDGDLSLPHCIVSQTNIPFECSSYWKTSNNKTHSLLDLILEDDVYKSFLRFHWSASWYGGIGSIVKWPYVPEKNETEDFASFLYVTDKDLALLKMSHPLEGTKMALYKVQNSTTHKSVDWALSLLTGYALVTSKGNSNLDDYYLLPWSQTFSRYIASTPASPKDVLLLIRVLKFMLVYVECALQHDKSSSGEAVNWIINSLTDKNFTMFSVLLKKNLYPEQNASDYNDITLLQSYIVKVLLYCMVYCECYGKGKALQNSDRWLSVLNTFLTCLNGLDLTNFEILGYVGEMVKCVRYLVQSQLFNLPEEIVLPAVKVLIKVAHTCPQCQNNYDGFKGHGVLFNLLIALSGLLQVMHRMDLTVENWTKTWFENKEKTLLMLFACCKCDRVELRTAAFHLIVGLTNNPINIFHLDEAISALDDGVLEFSTKVLVDVTEASIVREQAARILLNIIMARNPEHNIIHHKEIIEHFQKTEVSNVVLSTLVEYCSEVKTANTHIDANIPFDYLENKEKWEVLLSKRNQLTPCVKVGYRTKPQMTMEFVAALANLVHGVICHENEEFINKWNEEGLFRMFFRCLYCQASQKQNSMTLFSAVCCLLSQASFVSQEVFGTLIETQDCITALLQILVNLDLDIHNLKMIHCRDEMWKNAFELIGVLMSNENGLIVVWRLLYEDDKILCFFQTLLFCLNSKSSDLRKAVYFCLSNLLNGFIVGSNISGDELIMLLNNTEVFASTASLDKKEPSLSQDKSGPKQICLIADIYNVEYSGEDLCETRCLAEDLCKCLIERYNIMNVNQHEFKGASNYEYLDALVSCLSALFSLSEKARFYAIHVGFTLHLLNLLHLIWNLLTIDGKPVEVLKSIQRNPSLLVLDRILILMINLMRDCSDAKDCLAENNVCVSLNKLWPWFMVTKSLRHNIIQFLDSFTNGCAKAWAAMHNCVALRCLLYEVIALLSKEMSTLTQAKQTNIIKGCLNILENCCAQIHCRTLILKSEVLNYIQKLHPAISKRRPVWKQIEKPWEQFLLEVTTYSEGQIKLMEHSAVMCALVLQADGLMLRVLTNCAFCSINRVKFTSSGEILHLFSVKLTMEENLDDKIAICGAIWALAANNHKAKLLLRNAGITADLRDCITSMKNMSPMDDLANQTCELMTYVQKVLTIS